VKFDALLVALARFGKSMIETGIIFASTAVLAVVFQPDISAEAVAAIAAFAFVKGVLEAAGRYLAAVKSTP